MKFSSEARLRLYAATAALLTLAGGFLLVFSASNSSPRDPGAPGLLIGTIVLQLVAIALFTAVIVRGEKHRVVNFLPMVWPFLQLAAAVALFFLLFEINKYHLSAEEFSDLVPGATSYAERNRYVFEGNSGGYSLVARIDLAPANIDEFLKGLNATPENPPYILPGEDVLPYIQNSVKQTATKTLPAWIDLSSSGLLEMYRAEGKNSFTSKSIYRMWVDRKKGTIWLEGGGI